VTPVLRKMQARARIDCDLSQWPYAS
jgi:hypothetical protein